ncbi:hypothetical protein D3H55_18615 [Bacillus salacetis]|uniref:NAD-dependent epimerase/dehydratase domain-containing protein n=1 Tax=Bacillus salacetis TaxID=2315464 RepID=A0A3A1QR59_9BACI|nr:NAD-dependent epimerase/dehydratase family protein [Bacillus salacetis]RIW29611.1 hypothetical protein D3H55_18615 [Bacillus salacetis]
MRNTLVIGGTGMLGGAVRHLVKRGDEVTVLARSTDKFNRMLVHNGLMNGDVSFMPADYFKTDEVVELLNEHIKTEGAFDAAVIWMRSAAAESFDAIMGILGRDGRPVDIFKVNGSSASRSPLPSSEYRSINMHQIILGFKIENGESRWLTDDEISEGVIKALNTRIPLTVAGVTEPWEKRPGY